MPFSFALAALAAAQAAAAPQSSSPQWVPLKQSAQPTQVQRQAPAQPVIAPMATQQAPLVIEQAPQPQEAGNALKQGTPIHLATDVEMNSQDNRAGDRIDLRVLDAVSLNGHTVIPVGTRGVGEITLARKKGMWGKSGRLEFRPLYLVLGGRQIPISTHSNTKEKGETGTAGVVASIVVLPLAGFFVTGTSARIPRGSTVEAELSEDLPVVFK
jgi:hypothetical protein